MTRTVLFVGLGAIVALIPAGPGQGAGRGRSAMMTAVQPVAEMDKPIVPIKSWEKGYAGTLLRIESDWILLQRPGDSVRRFFLWPSLAAGEGPAEILAQGRLRYMYRVSDLRVGDKLEIDFHRVDRVNVCVAICIRRRPGGRVPPVRGRERGKIRYHEYMNAFQDWEEKRIPLPNLYALSYLYQGTVAGIGTDWISIDRPGQPLRRFALSPSLAAGKGPTDSRYRRHPIPFELRKYEGIGYRRTDVQLGDKVDLFFGRVDGVDVCDSIYVMRRPGGRVPPCPGEDASQAYHHHEHMNALQDWEERGIRPPDKYAQPIRRISECVDATTEIIPRAER